MRFVFVYFLGVQSFDDWGCGVPVAVSGFQGVDQKLQEDVHVVFVLDDQVDVAMLHDQSDAIPAVKRKFLDRI